RDRDLEAGAWLGLLAAKPNVAVFFFVALLLAGRRRASLGMLLSGGLLWAGSLALVGPDGWAGLLAQLAQSADYHSQAVVPAVALARDNARVGAAWAAAGLVPTVVFGLSGVPAAARLLSAELLGVLAVTLIYCGSLAASGRGVRSLRCLSATIPTSTLGE